MLLSLTSCASLGNFLWSGHWEDPNAAEAKSTPEEESTPEAEANTPSAKPSIEQKMPVLPIDTTFAHGQWLFLRTSRALFAWTGAGEQFRLFAIELDSSAMCWNSKQADRPEAEHCARRDAPLSSVRNLGKVGEKEVENIFAKFDKALWKPTTVGAPLPEGMYDLPDTHGGVSGTYTLKSTANEVKVSTPRFQGGLVFTAPSGSNAFLVDDAVHDLFDGCTGANNTLPVLEGMTVRLGKKKCDILRDRDDSTVTLVLDYQKEVSFSRTNEAPNLVALREDAAMVRQNVAGKASVQFDISGDATHTLATVTAKRHSGEAKSEVHAIATLQGVNYRCDAEIERIDPAWIQDVKQICGSMAKK